ncbi:MAG: hypothetical protein ABI823_07965 [Bryobacteraceae bacterium]
MKKPSVPFWLLPNVLSLDAPVVAVLWQDLLARSEGVEPRASGRAVLFLTVWAIYLADRLLDARLSPQAVEAPRHRFYREHWRAAAGLLALVASLDLLVTVLWLRPSIFLSGMLVFAAVGVYFGLIHWLGSPAVPKELAAALLFAAGVQLVPWSLAPGLSAMGSAHFAGFFGLCFSNLVMIELWEWRGSAAGADRPNALTLLAGSAMYWLLGVLVLVSAIRWSDPASWAIALSAMALAGLWASSTRLSPDVRRVCADAALLTPCLVFLLR